MKCLCDIENLKVWHVTCAYDIIQVQFMPTYDSTVIRYDATVRNSNAWMGLLTIPANVFKIRQDDWWLIRVSTTVNVRCVLEMIVHWNRIQNSCSFTMIWHSYSQLRCWFDVTTLDFEKLFTAKISLMTWIHTDWCASRLLPQNQMKTTPL